MPRRSGPEGESDRQRDQEGLWKIPGHSRVQVERDLAALKKERNEEIARRSSSAPGRPSSGDTRARCKRNGKDIYMRKRTSVAERDRDQMLLDSIEVGLSDEALELRVEEIKAQRDREITKGVLETCPSGPRGTKRQKRAK